MELISCQNSNPCSRFQKVKMMLQTRTWNLPEQPKAKQLPMQKHPGNKAGQWQGCRWREGIDMTKSCWWGAHQRLGRENQTDLVPFWPSLSSHLYIHVLLSWSYQRMLYVLCWFAAATQNILDMSPANHYSEGFNSLENEDILTMNYNSFGLKTEMIHADIFKDPRVNSA